MDQPVPPAMARDPSDEHRSSTLLGNIAEEQNQADELCDRIFNHEYVVYLIKDSASCWTEKDHGAKNYGITPDNTTLMHLYAVLRLDEPGQEIPCPPVGSTCTLYMPSVTYTKRQAPRYRASANEVDTIARSIMDNLDLVECQAQAFADEEYSPLDYAYEHFPWDD
jgi:hypothetical protein